jgi:hypothetical protein
VTAFDYATRALVIIGALNWGLVAVAEFDLVAEIFGLSFGETNSATRIIYGLVGLAALWELIRLFTARDTVRTTTRTPLPNDH